MKVVKVAIIALVLLAMELVVSITLYQRTSAVAFNGLMAGYDEDVTRLSKNFIDAVNGNESAAPDYTATLTGESLEINGKTYSVAANVAKRLKADKFNVYTLAEACDTATTDEFISSEKRVFAIYGTANPDETVTLSFKDMNAVTEDISYGGFKGLAVFSDSRRTVYLRESEGENVSTLQDIMSYRPKFPDSGASTQTMKVGDTTYAVSLIKLDDIKFYVGAYADFSAMQAELDSLRLQTVLTFAALGILTVVLVVVGAYLTGGRAKGYAHKYRIVTDAQGKILKTDPAFAQDFPDTHNIKERVNRFDENGVYAITVQRGGDEKVLACQADKRANGTIVLSADALSVPFGTEIETEFNNTMESVYESVSDKKQVLVGELFFENLHDVKVIFGKDFTESVRNVLIERIREKFEYVFQMDYYHIGVLQPEGKNYKAAIRDLAENVAYFNKAVKASVNIVKPVVKCGFAISDEVMESRDYNYVMTAVRAALRRSQEKIDDAMLKTDYYLYRESQKKLYARYFFKIDIDKFLANGDFYLEYQPQYDVKLGKIVAFEALFRTNKRLQVNASTADIINYAEQTGYMVVLGDFIFDTGMRFAKSIEGTGVSVSLNVSLIQLMQSGFVDNFMNFYRKYDLKPGSISIEVTESYLLRTIDETVSKLNILRNNGIGIHLDDFGTAYSSFHYLQKLPITAIKVDQVFIKDICKNKHSRLISKMIIEIADSLNLRSICEGVETTAQLKTLKEINVDIIQGFLISRSVTEDKARDMIAHYVYEEKPEEPESSEEQNQDKQGA